MTTSPANRNRDSSGRMASMVRRAIQTLPSPRDEAALGAARHLKAVLTGSPPPTAPAKKTAAKKTAATKKTAGQGHTGNGVSGRWIRPVRTPEGVAPATDREVTDPTEAAAVRAGWLLIDAHERMSSRGAERIFRHELEAWHDYVRDTVVPLVHPADGGSMEVKEDKGNLLRYRRTMDFALPGDHVFDVGFGQGYLAAQLIRERGVQSYHGIDISMGQKPVAEALFAANGLTGEAINLEYGNLFDLTRDQVAATGANLVICCEVLEHVDDAELALRILADALPEGVDLVFSVPLHGRLEQVWGHLSVFDVARLKEMLDGAGLHAHHVEPLSNTWSLVVASRTPEPSARVRQSAGRPPVRSSVPLTEHRTFVNVDASDIVDKGQVTTERTNERRVVCHVVGNGGVSFPVEGLEAMRLWLKFTDVEHVEQFVVTAWANGSRAGSWVWAPEAWQMTGPMRRFALRPGEMSGPFKSEAHRNLDQADHVDVVAVLASGQTADFECMAAYLP